MMTTDKVAMVGGFVAGVLMMLCLWGIIAIGRPEPNIKAHAVNDETLVVSCEKDKYAVHVVPDPQHLLTTDDKELVARCEP